MQTRERRGIKSERRKGRRREEEKKEKVAGIRCQGEVEGIISDRGEFNVERDKRKDEKGRKGSWKEGEEIVE